MGGATRLTIAKAVPESWAWSKQTVKLAARPRQELQHISKLKRRVIGLGQANDCNRCTGDPRRVSLNDEGIVNRDPGR